MRPSVLAGILGSSVILPSTQTYTSAQFQPGLMGSTSTTQAAGKVSLLASLGMWVGYITGTAAELTAFQNTSSTPAGMIEVSLDGGSFAAATVTGGKYVLFTGLSQATRLVMIRVNSAYAATGNIPASGNVLSVTGAPPSIEMTSGWVQPQDSSSNALAAATTVANAANFSPRLLAQGTSTYGSNVPMVVIRGNFRKLWAAGHFSHLYVSIDGAAPTRYTVGTGSVTITNPRATVITGLSGDRTYYVWGTKNASSGGGHFAVGGDAARGALTPSRRLYMFGDSITEGVGATTSGEVEAMRVAAGLGLCGSTSGVAGNTIAQLKARLATVLAGMQIGASDVAVLAIGRNNTGGAFDATETTDYTDIVTTLRANFSKVLCRGIFPDGAGSYTAENGSIASIVSGFADPAVVDINANAWTGITFADGVHPNDAGYVTLAGYAQPAYAAVI